MANTSSYPEISIILVDDDSISLSILEKVLQSLNYHVAAFKSPLDALFSMRTRKRSFNLVLTDVHMPEMSGLELLKIVDKEFKLPVVLMSSDKNIDIMIKGLEDGAAFYLVKPISANYLSRLWQYAIPVDSTNKSSDTSGNTTKAPPSVSMPPMIIRPPSALRIHDQQLRLQVNNNNNNNNFVPLPNDQFRANTQLLFTNNPLKRLNPDELGMIDYSTNKKPKLVWTTYLHNLFLEALNKLGAEKAVPKKILEYMNVPGLKRENVASHLQKYRIFLNRIQELTKSMQNGIPNNWNERPFKSSFVLNEITFLTKNLQQQYLELMAHAQGKLNDVNFFEKGQSSIQMMNSSPEAITPTNEAVPINHIQLYPSKGTETLNQNILEVDQLLPTFNSGQQRYLTRTNFEQGQSSRAITNLSNHRVTNLQPTTNNYVGLRINANGELISPLHNLSTTIFNGDTTNDNVNSKGGGNSIENIEVNQVNYEMNYDYNHNSFHNNNSPLVDDIFGVDDMNVYIPSLDHNVTLLENSFGVMSPDLSNIQGIGDELRQLGINIQFDQETFTNDFGFGSFDLQGDNLGSLFERFDQGITNNDDISFECYFAEEEFSQDNGRPNFTSPN